VVLAAVLYVMVVNIIRPIDGQRPIVTLGSLGCDGSVCQGRVIEASPPEDLGIFRLTVLADGDVAIDATDLAAGVDLSGGGLTFRYTDVGGEEKMTGGDTFRVSGTTAGTAYEVIFLWHDGSVVSSLAFET
jgi:hypothetical protein